MSPRTKSGIVGGLALTALDERVAIVGTSGSGKTYAAKGLVELLLTSVARICVVDPLGVWWGLRSSADGITPGFPVIVFGGRHADVPLDEGMGAALGRVVGTYESLALRRRRIRTREQRGSPTVHVGVRREPIRVEYRRVLLQGGTHSVAASRCSNRRSRQENVAAPWAKGFCKGLLQGTSATRDPASCT
jgi:hypothetical protein